MTEPDPIEVNKQLLDHLAECTSRCIALYQEVQLLILMAKRFQSAEFCERVRDVMRAKMRPYLDSDLFDTISPDDLLQTVVGDCWLIFTGQAPITAYEMRTPS